MARTGAGPTWGDIEERTGLLRCYISRVENGHTIPSLGTVENWAVALGVEVYQIFYQGDQPQAAKAAPAEAFKSRERALLDDYHLVPWRERGMVEHLIRSLAQHGKGKGWRKGVAVEVDPGQAVGYPALIAGEGSTELIV